MKRVSYVIYGFILAFYVFFSGTALGDSVYVSIQDICANIPQRWTSEYINAKGVNISIDVPIVVPQVEMVPIVRIMRDGPAENISETITVFSNTREVLTIALNYPFDDSSDMPAIEDGITLNSDMPWLEAQKIATDTLRNNVPLMTNKELVCYYMKEFGTSATNCEYRLNFYNTFHGIPYLVGNNFLYSVEDEHAATQPDDESAVPFTTIDMFIRSPDQFWTIISTSKEAGVEVADVPLLPFESILKVLEQQVSDGYVYSLNEVRLGYMSFIDVNKKGEEFLLLPVWVAKGRTTGDPNIPFDLKTSQDVLDQNGYQSKSIIVINAQTGEVYDLYYDKRPDRRYVPKIVLWDDVK